MGVDTNNDFRKGFIVSSSDLFGPLNTRRNWSVSHMALVYAIRHSIDLTSEVAMNILEGAIGGSRPEYAKRAVQQFMQALTGSEDREAALRYVCERLGFSNELVVEEREQVAQFAMKLVEGKRRQLREEQARIEKELNRLEGLR